MILIDENLKILLYLKVFVREMILLRIFVFRLDCLTNVILGLNQMV